MENDHKLVSTANGSIAMRYSCGKETFNKTTKEKKCLKCGHSVTFDKNYALTHVYKKIKNEWILFDV